MYILFYIYKYFKLNIQFYSHAFECMVISYVGMVCATAACFSCAVDGELHEMGLLYSIAYILYILYTINYNIYRIII